MPLVKAQVTLPFFTNLPKDVITNSLWFGTPSGVDLETAATTLIPEISEFYRDIYNPGIAWYVRRDAAFVRFYDWADPEPRQPVQLPLDLTGVIGANTDSPTEQACVLSFHGEPTSGVPAARMRGRIYLGAITGVMMDPVTSSGFFPTYTDGFVEQVANAANGLRLRSGTASCPWVVYSRATGGLTPWYEVTAGWVDDSPDTQRRRSVEATSRYVWPPVIP